MTSTYGSNSLFRISLKIVFNWFEHKMPCVMIESQSDNLKTNSGHEHPSDTNNVTASFLLKCLFTCYNNFDTRRRLRFSIENKLLTQAWTKAGKEYSVALFCYSWNIGEQTGGTPSKQQPTLSKEQASSSQGTLASRYCDHTMPCLWQLRVVLRRPSWSWSLTQVLLLLRPSWSSSLTQWTQYIRSTGSRQWNHRYHIFRNHQDIHRIPLSTYHQTGLLQSFWWNSYKSVTEIYRIFGKIKSKLSDAWCKLKWNSITSN